MTRRRVVVLSSAGVLLGLGLIAALAVVAVLKTQYGRDVVRNYVEEFAAPRVHGKLSIGRITGLSFGGARIDSVEIRGADDSLLVSLGSLTAHWDARDLVDKRTLLSLLEIDGLVVHLRKDTAGVWNFRKIFPPGAPKKRVPGAERGWGDYIVADSVAIRNGAFFLTMPWHPDDSLRGVKRDSAITRNLTRTDKEIRRSREGFTHTWRWTDIQLALSYMRLADPDSVGRAFQIASLQANEFDPPFRFRNVRGGVRQYGDSLWLDVAHFDLPGSTGTGAGKVVWGSGLDTRYDLRIVGDSVSLADVAWVYPDLPETGGGSMVLNIRNQRNLKIIDYVLSDMDVRTTRSRLKGAMTFGVGGPVLIVKDVALEAAPVNFDLLRTLAGGPFSYDWQGDLTGTVRARGGPLNRFRVDDARVTFDDANVPGAVTRGTGRGELDILFPAFTTFRGFDVDVAQLDLRTLQHLNPNFPRVNGIVSGRATLDSMYLDVRFHNADLTHRDGPGEPTRATGSGRVTIGDVFTTYDLALMAQPLSFTTLARSYPSLPLRGSYHGPMRLQGSIDDLALTTELTGPAGTFGYDGRLDAYPVAYAARGTLTFANLDVRRLLENDTLPATSLTGRMQLDVSADSASRDSTLRSVAGVVSLNLERSLVDSNRIYSASARLGFNQGRVRIDTVRVESVAGALAGSGAFGLTSDMSDSLDFLIVVDSLGGLRRYLGGTLAQADLDTPAAADSLDGAVMLRGTAFGNIDSVRVAGELDANNLWIRGDRAQHLAGGFEATSHGGTLTARTSLRADTLLVSGIGVDSATVFFNAPDRTHGEFAVHAVSTTGPAITAIGSGERRGDTTIVRLDSLRLTVRDHRLALQRPGTIAIAPDGIVLDSLELRDVKSGALLVTGRIPESAPIALAFRADSLELGDVGALLQTNAPLGGLASAAVDVTGVRAAPRIVFSGALDAPRFGDVRLDRATFGGSYQDRRLATRAELFREERPVVALSGSIPVDLSFVNVPRRMLEDSLRGTIRSDSVELAILEMFSPAVLNASGTFAANIDIGGVWPKVTLGGNLSIAGGALGLAPLGDVRLSNVNANLSFLGDSIQVERLTAVTREERTGTVSLSGYASVADRDNPRFDMVLNARDFHIIDRPRIAHLDVSASNLRLAGSYNRSRLTGLVTVERGTVFIPELIQKNVISLDSPDLYTIIDTTLTTNRTLLPKPPPELLRNMSVENVQVQMGNDVWLRSAEANINLGGSVGVTVGHAGAAGRPFDQLALDGTLLTTRGTYRLNLGIYQRTFTVEEGRIQFLGDPDFNPFLDINATHTVRRYSTGISAQQDLRIRVHIGGTLAQPQLTLASADSLLNISQTDLLSYLITGAPSNSVTTESAAASLLRSAGSYFGDVLRGGLGGFFDVVDIDLGRQGLRSSQGQSSSVFSGAQLTLGHQIGDRAFVRASTGLCQVGSLFGAATTNASATLYQSLGVRVDYRLNSNVGVSAGFEPPTNALVCNAGVAAARGFVDKDRQWGFDIFRTWRF